MVKILVALNLVIASMGGLTYGERFPASEGLYSEAARQAERTRENRIASNQKETREEKSYDQESDSSKASRECGHGFKSGITREQEPSCSSQVRERPARETGEGQRNHAHATQTPRENYRVSNANDTGNSVNIYHHVFTITAYTAGYESTQKKPGEKGYGITATGTTVLEGRTIAADWSVLPPGTEVQIDGLEGVYIVEDRGGGVKGHHIDLYIESLERAKAWGRQKRDVTVLKWGS